MIRSYECMVIPGLLQTPEYSKAVFLGGGAYSKSEVQCHVDARMQRQHILGRHKPPRLWAVIDEAALHRELEDLEIMREQLQHLLNMATRHNIDIQGWCHTVVATPQVTGVATTV